ncbi:unnamed protein product, partial [Symbiodinium necroappetens]
EQEELAHKFAAAIPAMPSSLARELAHMALAAGATSCIQLDACQTFEVADSYQCYFVPVQTPPAPTFGQTGAHAPGYRYSYVWCHGTDISTAALILKELQDWLQDHDYLDTRRSIGNLSCPRYVVSSAWAREKGLAGIPVTNLHPAHFLYQGWNSYWLRWIAAGKEAYFIVARTKAEMVLAGELLSQIRAQGLDIDAAATNLAVQTQASQAKNIAVKALGQFLVDQVKSKIPVETDYEFHARIRELEGQIGNLQQQLKQQQQSAGAPSANPTGVGAPGPSTPPPSRGSNADRSPLATPAESSTPGSTAKPKSGTCRTEPATATPAI